MSDVYRMTRHYDGVIVSKGVVFDKTMTLMPLTDRGNTHQLYEDGCYLIMHSRGLFPVVYFQVMVCKNGWWHPVNPETRKLWLENVDGVILDWLEDLNNDEPLSLLEESA